MEEQKNKRILNIQLDNEVKKVSITGKNCDEQVVMRQELSEDDLEQATGGWVPDKLDTIFDCSSDNPHPNILLCPNNR